MNKDILKQLVEAYENDIIITKQDTAKAIFDDIEKEMTIKYITWYGEKVEFQPHIFKVINKLKKKWLGDKR